MFKCLISHFGTQPAHVYVVLLLQAHSLLAGVFHTKKSIWLREIEPTMTSEVKSTTLNEMWDLLPPVQLCDCEIIEEKGGEGYLTDQPWSLVAAQSVIVNTYLLHVNHGACLIIHSLTCERQHVNTSAHALLLCSVVWCIAKICPGREKEKNYEGLKKDRK